MSSEFDLDSKSKLEKRNKQLTVLAFTVVGLGLMIPILILSMNNLYRAGHIHPYLQQVFLQVKDLGTIGDWIGGSATPLLNLGAFILLLVSLNYQKVETQQAREEFKLTMAELNESRALAREQGNLIKQQKFETTFFNLLNIFFLKEKDAKASHDPVTVSGMLSIEHEDFFTDLYLKTRAEYNILDRQAANDENKKLRLIEKEYEKIKKSIQPQYVKHRSVLDPYYGTMHNILRSISTLESNDDRKYYLKIFMSHLTVFEVIWLFYFRLLSPNAHFSNLIEDLKIFNFFASSSPNDEEVVTIEDDLLLNENHRTMFIDMRRSPEYKHFPRMYYPEIPVAVPPEVRSVATPPR